MLPGLPPALVLRARRAAAWVRAQDEVLVVHHVDADGVTGGAIALEALTRANIASRSLAVKSLDDVHVELVHQEHADALWFTDLGSAVHMRFAAPKLVCDHHELVRDGGEESFPHVNPLLDDLPGSTVSGAGTAFLVALALDEANLDLLPVALVGASADLQDRQGGFHGANAALLAAGQAAGLVEVERDLAWFGPETRALRKFLALAREPAVPTATGDVRAADAFLDALDIPLAAAGRERTWALLDPHERRRIRTALVERLVAVGLHDRADKLFRDVVRVTAEAPGTPVRELQEFGTLLNSTARYGRPDVGLAVARGDRGAAYEEALSLLQGHRRHLVGALDAFAQAPVQEGDAIQWVHLGDRVLDTVVGIVAGMALDGLGLRRDRALLAFAHTPDGRTKASARAPSDLQGRIDLATALREAAAAHGGQGGGHAGAAGATIPRGAEAAFVALVDAALAHQMRPRSTTRLIG